MHIRSGLIAIAALAALTTNSLATGLGRCENLDPIITPDIVVPGADIIEIQKQYQTFTGSDAGGYNYASLLRVCTDPDSTHRFAQTMRENGACIRTGAELRSMTSHTGGAVVVGKKAVVVGKEDDTIIDVPDIDQYREGQVDVKDSAKAYAAAVLEAIKTGQPIPKPGPQYEVIDWNPPQEGSCN